MVIDSRPSKILLQLPLEDLYKNGLLCYYNPLNLMGVVMFLESNVDNRIEKMQAGIKEAEIAIEMMQKQIDALMNYLEATPEAITTYLQNPKHFTEKDWQLLQQMKQQAQEKLEHAKGRDVLAAKKKQAERNVAPHWLFVR